MVTTILIISTVISSILGGSVAIWSFIDTREKFNKHQKLLRNQNRYSITESLLLQKTEKVTESIKEEQFRQDFLTHPKSTQSITENLLLSKIQNIPEFWRKKKLQEEKNT